MPDLLPEIQEIFRDIFDNEKLVITRESNASNVEDWDSLAHVNLVTAIEKKYKIKFGLGELQELISGMSPRSQLVLIFHFRDLEDMGLVDHETGDALLRVDDGDDAVAPFGRSPSPVVRRRAGRRKADGGLLAPR